jgi:hypothetical protein
MSTARANSAQTLISSDLTALKLKKQRTEEKMKLEEMVKLIMQKPRILDNGMFDPIQELVTDAVVHLPNTTWAHKARPFQTMPNSLKCQI